MVSEIIEHIFGAKIFQRQAIFASIDHHGYGVRKSLSCGEGRRREGGFTLPMIAEGRRSCYQHAFMDLVDLTQGTLDL